MAVVLRRASFPKTKFGISDLNSRTHLECFRCFADKRGNANEPSKEEQFRVLKLYPKTETENKTERRVIEPNPPRVNEMTPDQDWTNVWPGPKTYHPASVPLPLLQGCNKHGPPPDRYANTELMKIPNFLHLTPPAIEKHCKALKKFCTKWPENLDTEEKIQEHFPVEIITSDYCHSSPSIRDPKARIVSLKIKLKSLEFNEHSKDKFFRLVGPRYDPSTDYVTITTDSCPLKKQNYDYAHYLLTAVYFESYKHEEWEKQKSNEDMETYKFSQRQSFTNLKKLFDYNQREMPGTKDFKQAVEDWQNKGDDRDTIRKYKESALKLLSLTPLEAQC